MHQINAGEGWMKGGIWNPLKGGETEKGGGETKILKRDCKLGEGVGALKRGLELPYKLWSCHNKVFHQNFKLLNVS